MNIIFETDRLLLRKFTMDDAQLVYDLNIDPVVTQYTGDPIRDLQHASEVLAKTILPQYALYNYGRWAVHLKDDFGFIGWCGLKNRPERNEIDLGYRFIQSSWGNGYATEAALASIHHGFNALHIERIVGRSMPQNTGSVKVLEKCGMIYIGENIVDNHPAKTYEIINPLIP